MYSLIYIYLFCSDLGAEIEDLEVGIEDPGAVAGTDAGEKEKGIAVGVAAEIVMLIEPGQDVAAHHGDGTASAPSGMWLKTDVVVLL